jgi:hypothetical protein
MNAPASLLIATQSLIVQYVPTQTQWTTARNGNTIRCKIGRWNFSGKCFVVWASGDGKSNDEALRNAERDLTAPQQLNDESLTLNYSA